MWWQIFKIASGVCGDVNACLELSDRVLGAIRARRMINTRQQLPDDNTAAQHQIQEETKLEQLRNDLWKLMTTMPKMMDLLDRVEWQSHNKAAADLLPYIKDAVYNAVDLLDEFDYYALKVKAEGARMSGQDHLHGAAFLELFDKVKEIQGNLDHIYDQSKDLKLNEAPQKFNESIRPETSSFSGEPEIFGRQKELKELVQKLGVQLHTRKRKRNASKMTELPVLPIVGLGGVGKTTIAQEICNDAKVKVHFGKHNGKDNIIWSCVSDEFDIKRLIKEILQHFEKQTSSDNLNVLMKDLARCVESKKFLLVLDDMWDDLLEDDGARWKTFCAPLREGLQGSTILVTTRSSMVANLVGTMKEHYELKGLQDDVFWDFFKLCAFGSNSSCNDRELLERIGKDILPKLKGSPLAAKTLGRLLKMDLSTAHWERILESELWQLEQKETDILPVLRLSYMYLPPHLKRCFSICALYPKDYIFERGFLVDIWIAQGYVEPKDASFHFDELVERSFFQNYRQSNKYVVHDLMHDMAQLVSKDECFIIRHASDLDRIPSNVRHLSIFTNGNVSCTELEIICDKKKLRSLVCNESFSRANDFAPVIDCWFRKLLKIRVFSFKLSEVRELPESMGNTKHLRYLHLFGSCTFSTLPSSVRSLHHLKIVDARDCEFIRFPQGFSDVISLQKFQSRNFSYEKDHCDKLCLKWCTPVPRGQQTSDQQEQMEALPHWNIQELTIKCYKGESCPSWLRPNLLPRLRSLEFVGCGNIQSIEAFSSLASLTLVMCDGLLSLDEFLTPDYLPVINCVRVNTCSKLTSLPVDRLCGFSRLQELSIAYCPKLNIQRVMTLPSCLKGLSLRECPSIESIEMGSSPALEHLYIEYCPDLRSIGGSIALAQIGSVWIDDCPGLTEVEQPFEKGGGYTARYMSTCATVRGASQHSPPLSLGE